MENNIQKKEKLLHYLEIIRDNQALKSPEEMDRVLLDNTVSVLLKLQNKKVELSIEEIKERVNNIPFVKTPEFEATSPKRKNKINKRRLLLIAATVAILCALLCIISSSHFLYHWHGVMKEKFGSMFNVPVGAIYTEGNDEFIYHGKASNYTNTQDFLKNEDYKVLLPNNLPKNIEIDTITIIESIDEIIISFNSCVTSYQINLNTSIPQIAIDNADELIVVNNLKLYIEHIEEKELTQIHFEHNGNYYIVCGVDQQLLLNIIENLEEP